MTKLQGCRLPSLAVIGASNVPMSAFIWWPLSVSLSCWKATAASLLHYPMDWKPRTCSTLPPCQVSQLARFRCNLDKGVLPSVDGKTSLSPPPPFPAHQSFKIESTNRNASPMGSLNCCGHKWIPVLFNVEKIYKEETEPSPSPASPSHILAAAVLVVLVSFWSQQHPPYIFQEPVFLWSLVLKIIHQQGHFKLNHFHVVWYHQRKPDRLATKKLQLKLPFFYLRAKKTFSTSKLFVNCIQFT